MARSAYVAMAALAVVLGVGGCAGPGNHDPRKGRVITHSSNCLTGDCVEDWKVCIGPDLLVHIDGASPSDYTVHGSLECRP